jgi:hypothetical protein
MDQAGRGGGVGGEVMKESRDKASGIATGLEAGRNS